MPSIRRSKDRIGQLCLPADKRYQYSPRTILLKLLFTSGWTIQYCKCSGSWIASRNKHQQKYMNVFTIECKSEKLSGFGIGLYIANEIIHRHNGTYLWKRKDKGSVLLYFACFLGELEKKFSIRQNVAEIYYTRKIQTSVTPCVTGLCRRQQGRLTVPCEMPIYRTRQSCMARLLIIAKAKEKLYTWCIVSFLNDQG